LISWNLKILLRMFFRRIAMARGDQLGRQWKIIQTLITSKNGKSASELAEGLDCHPRTVYRDLQALQVAGTDEIRFWIMTWGSKAEVLEPGSLREEIRVEAEEMARRYEGPIVAEESLPYGVTKGHRSQLG
jgi:predicted DNA-binding transcriptional regulator YafY